MDMPDPFDDPEVKAAMAAAGIVHKPGMAKEMMTDLAPLLAAEGIDINNLDDTDLDAVNAALARVTEQHNLKLFTPVGERRSQSLTVLRQFSEALSRGDDALAMAIATAIQPEPTETLPAVSHVIGAGLGLLDTWSTNPELQDVLEHPHIPPWQRQARAAARTILARAREGRAFDSLNDLIIRYQGLAVFDGTALAVAASVEAVALDRGVDVDQAFDELLAEDARPPVAGGSQAPSRGSKTSTRAKHVSGHPGRRDQNRSDYAAIRTFGVWLRSQETIAAPSVDEETRMFEALLKAARDAGIDFATPFGLERLVDEICLLDEDDHSFAAAALATLDDYVHFRLQTSDDHSGWAGAHEEVELAMDEISPSMGILDDVIELADQIDPEDLRAAFAETRVAAMVPALLEWIGKGRKCSSTGALRRTDIAQTAAMLGISAVGVNRLPPYEPGAASSSAAGDGSPSTIYAMSMYDVPLLAPWWAALRTAEVIQTTATMVRPGPTAAEWLAETLPPMELAEKVIGIFIAEMLLQDLRRCGWYEEEVVALTVARLIRALTPGDEVLTQEESALNLMLEPRVTDKLRLLEQMGLAEWADDEIIVPPLLRGVVARGLLVTGAMLEHFSQDDE